MMVQRREKAVDMVAGTTAVRSHFELQAPNKENSLGMR